MTESSLRVIETTVTHSSPANKFAGLGFVLFLLMVTVPGWTQEKPPGEIVLREGLIIASVGRYGRTALHTDAIEARIVTGKWAAPKSGETVRRPDGTVRTWQAAVATPDGWIRDKALEGGYAFFSVDAPAERVMLLDATAHNMVYVNGEPRIGDMYETGKTRLPVRLRAGKNEFLFQCARGRLRAKLVPPASPLMIDLSDATLPDLIAGEKEPVLGAMVVLNTTASELANLRLTSLCDKGKPMVTVLPILPPFALCKVGFRIAVPPAPKQETVTLQLGITYGKGRGTQVAAVAETTLRVRRPDQSHKRTFLSSIDGSVQYYGINPAQTVGSASALPALFLTLHGAGVEAIGQAEAYSPKSWGHLIAPTNRRPYGFDWEDWGRLDAMEVLDLAQQRFRADPRRVYLTGHSMGGHGVWQIGATFPDRFAALGPSAGWISFQSYVGGARNEKPDPLHALLQRAAASSDTLALSRNYLHHGIYILHGDADDNVPVSEARAMAKRLGEFHHDFVLYEQSGAGHWWDNSDEPGAECVDWPPMFDLFARHQIPAEDEAREVDFTTVNPGVSARSRWLTIEAQIRQLAPSSVRARSDPGQRRFVATTENVARLSFSLQQLRPGSPLQVELDGQKLSALSWPLGTPRLWFAREGEVWKRIEEPSPSLKGPHRYGLFKDAFHHRVLFVCGTKGTLEENAWAYAKARYDAETFWYRGNGAVDILADVEFNPTLERDRSVILYGNADTNAAWKTLLADSPVQIRRGSARVGERELTGDDLACLFIRPRPDSPVASVGVVSGSGLAGMRLTDRMPYFLSGVAYPDCLILQPETLSEDGAGVLAAGFFGLDWGVASGEFLWSAKP